MRLTAFTDVCLRVLMTLAQGAEQDPAPRPTAHELADRIGIPYHHVTKAVAELRRRGLVAVARGRVGGAHITDAGLDQRVGALVRDLMPREEVVDCAGLETGVPCPYAGRCRLRGALARAREAFLAELDLLAVRDLVAPAAAPGPGAAAGSGSHPVPGADGTPSAAAPGVAFLGLPSLPGLPGTERRPPEE